ncbi:MAG: helicase C-terminal domain-containing protein, partial [Verrucomicrobiales bacterium]|nr:helicase C-terminal domain-containing protein [Verrucomicrobiales bacterium]
SINEFLEQSLDGHVYWVEKPNGSGDNIVLNSAPSDVSHELNDLFFNKKNACVLTSATLSVGENKEPIGYFKNRIGAESVYSVRIGSPFDYEKQMRVYLVKSIQDPRSDGYEADLIRWIEHFVEKSKGRAFVLFTSYKLMNSVALKMDNKIRDMGYKLLVQGKKMPRNKLLNVFREDSSSVLFGTDSFWAGVDVPGDALSNVIVTRLPFAVPDHPLTASRLESIEESGGNPFLEYTVPEAILKLRQGVGRLVRSSSDQGIVVILDNRILLKQYGKAFIRALPDAPIEIVED